MSVWRKAGRFMSASFYLAIAIYGTYFLLVSRPNEFSTFEKITALSGGWCKAIYKLLTWQFVPKHEPYPMWFWFFVCGMGLLGAGMTTYLIWLGSLPLRNYVFASAIAFVSLLCPLFGLAIRGRSFRIAR